MDMNPEAEDLAQRVRAARLERLSAQRMRRLAAERVEQLERELKNAAEAGLRTEISRSLDARARLRAAGRRKSAVRYSGFAALGLLLAAALLVTGWSPLQDAAVAAKPVLQAPVLAAAPGDRLALALSYSVSLPAAR
jgi:hypothetical protein